MGPGSEAGTTKMLIPIFGIRLDPNPNHRHNSRIPLHQKGRLAIVTNAGRDAVDAEVPITNGTEAYGEVVWS
jgi:hypothetical protein